MNATTHRGVSLLALGLALSTGCPSPDPDPTPPADHPDEARLVAELTYLSLYGANSATAFELTLVLSPTPPEGDADHWSPFGFPGPVYIFEEWTSLPSLEVRHALDGSPMAAADVAAAYTPATEAAWFESLTLDATGTIVLEHIGAETVQIAVGAGRDDPFTVAVPHDVWISSGPLTVTHPDGVLLLDFDAFESPALLPGFQSTSRRLDGSAPFTWTPTEGDVLTGTVSGDGETLQVVVAVDGDADPHPFGYYTDLDFLTDPFAGPNEGPAAPFTLESLTGETVSLSDHAGQVVVLDFWAYWCPYCYTGLGNLEALQAAHPGVVAPLGIAFDDGVGFTLVESTATGLGLTFPILESTDAMLADYGLGLDATVLPIAIVIDGNGVIRDRLVGTHTYEELEAAVLAAASQ